MSKRFCEMSVEELIREGGYPCTCGKHHSAKIRYIQVGRGAAGCIAQALEALEVKKPFVVCDRNTRDAAWPQVRAALNKAGIRYAYFCFDIPGQLEPDEHAMGSLVMAFDPSCDVILAIGSGVINDCCKVLAHATGRKQVIVGTAPSMDGYASASSSMISSRCKVSINNICPDAIIADTLIMSKAPDRMLWAGLGDMLAKYIALCEWRITKIINGEYYCEEVAALMRCSLEKIVAAAPRLMDREPETIGAIVEGLILSGIAMAYAGVSRPASGQEHYFSHLWEMFALDRGQTAELHGIQVGVGTRLCLGIYDRIRTMKPDRETAEAAMRAFDTKAWEAQMHRVFGGAAKTLIDNEYTRWHKNDPVQHAARLDTILAHWEDILQVIREELPDLQALLDLMRSVGMPMHPQDIGVTVQEAYDALVYARNSRDKYLTGSMLWDLGLLQGFELDV